MLEALGDLHVPSECFLADDLAISYYLALVQRFTVRRLRLRTKYNELRGATPPSTPSTGSVSLASIGRAPPR